MLRVALASVAATIVALTILTPGASAHAGDQSYLYLDITETVSGRLEMPFGDVREFLGLTLDGSSDEIAAEIDARADDLREYAFDHVELGLDGEAWTLTPTEVAQVSDIDYVAVHFDVGIAAPDFPQEFSVSLDPFFDELPTRDALLVIGNDWDRGYIENEAEFLVRFAGDSREQTVDLGDASWVKNLTASISLGVDHIKTGPDHILFVAVLVLPSVLVFSTVWRPAPRFRSSLWRVIEVVSMFTIAHTITFTLAGLGVLPLPSSRIIESVIALSIAAAALHNIRPIAPGREWLIAFAFGLFHGMGFASLVSDLDVSRGTQLISLAGRNIGIEIGQIVVVLLVFPGLFLLRRTRYYYPGFLLASAVLVVIGLGWMTERLVDAPDITTTVVERVIEFPMVLVLIALFTAVAAGTYAFERRRGRLISIDDRPPDGPVGVDAVEVLTG